jgi:hypothetical protein
MPLLRSAPVSLVIMLIWLLLYLRVAAPINRSLTAAADARQTAANGRALQRGWDRIILPRAILQGLAVLALAGSPIV